MTADELNKTLINILNNNSMGKPKNNEQAVVLKKVKTCLSALSVQGYIKSRMGCSFVDRSSETGPNYIPALSLGSVYLVIRIGLDEVRYTAMINSTKGDGNGVADSCWFDDNDSSNCPVEAIENAMKRAREYVKSLHETLNNNKFLMMHVS